MNEAGAPSGDILFAECGHLGHATMNRPKALNALTLGMSLALDAKLKTWTHHPKIQTVAITGAGDRAFCAGGDIRALYESGPGGKLTREFYWREYRLNRRIHRFPKDYVALIDGIAMGGGVGVSMTGRFRAVSERALFAMPETGIGLFPDVGATYFLTRTPGQLGAFLGLAGARLKAADLVYCGLATHYIPSAGMAELLAALEREPAKAALERLAQPAGDSPLAAHRAAIDRCFAGDTIEAILDALAREANDWAKATRETLLQKSPTSLRVALRQLRMGVSLDFEECMRLEYRLVQRFMAGGDFFEGVRSVVIDRDNAPRWNPARLEDVDAAGVDRYFASLGPDELTFED